MPEKGTIGLKVVADLSDVRKEIGGLGRTPFSLKLDDKAFSQPLGRITGKLGEFDKSLEASNARVIAFGASAGAIYAIEKALKSTVNAAINVEKQLADINVILNASSKNLAQFGDKLFRIAATTGQSFQTVATAATELARQGLSVEETLKRTSDALVLTRLSGLNAVSSVESLTAAINSFNKTALNSTEIVNKLANVDAAFAVSSADLAEALRRVGSTAADAGVSFDQLVAAVTSAQQTTARGGSVIGNSFKTIFTRLQRPAVLNQLDQLGIKTKTLGNETRPVIGILSDLAKVYDKLGSSQRSQISELIGGVFQINIVKAALSDLGKEYSFYDRALKTSAASTNEAIKRNEELNKTLSALINKTFANLEKVGSRVGEGAFGPAIKTVLGAVNAALDSSDTEKGAKDFGGKMAEGIFKGLGDFLSGPGLVIGGALLIKLFGRLSTTLADAFKTINTNNKATQVRIKLEEQAFNWLAKHPDILAKIVGGTMSIKDAQKQVVDSIKMSTTALNVQYTAVQKVVSAIMAGGKVSMETGLGAGKISSGSLKAGGGLVPTRKERDGEKALAAAYGYSAGGVMADNIEGVGRVVYNNREKKVKFPGMSTEAIIPPKSSKAGKTYKKDFKNKHGFDPYSASENMADGYVPNFAKFTDPLSFKRDGNKYQISGNVKNILGLYGKHQGVGSKFWKHMQEFHKNKRTGNRRGRKPSKLEQDDLVTMTAMVQGFKGSQNPRSLERIARKHTGSADPAAIFMGKKSKMISGVGKVGKGGDAYSKANKLRPGQIKTDSEWVQKGGVVKTKKGFVGKQGTELYPTDLASGSVAGFDFERGDAKRNLKNSLVGNDAKNFYKATIGKNLRASLMENDYVRGFKEATKERRDRVTLGNYLLATAPDQLLPDSMENERFKSGKAKKRTTGIKANVMARGHVPNFARRVFDKDAYLQKYADKGLLQSRLDETGARNIAELFDHDVMQAGKKGNLTLINAPPGAGKTSLAVGKTGKGQMTFDSNSVKGGDKSVVVRASESISSGKNSIMNRAYAPFVDKFISLLPDSEAIRAGRESRNKSGKFMFGRGSKQTSGATTDFDAAAAVLHSAVPFGKHKGLGRGVTGGWNMMSGSSFPAAHTVPVATTRGAFSPFTKGHQSVVDQMRKTGMPMSINVSGGVDREADIGWSKGRKRDLIKQTNPDAFVFSSKVPPETFTAPSDMTVKVGNKNIKIKKGDAINTASEGSKMFLGSDRAQQSKTGKSGLFDITEVNRTGADISATKVRQAIASGDRSAYSSMLGGPTTKFVDENIGDIQRMQGMIGNRNIKKLAGVNNQLTQLWGEMGIPFDPSARSPVLSAKRKKEFPSQAAAIQKLKDRKKGLGSHKWTKRVFPNLAGGHVPNFASKSDAAVIQTMTQKLFGPKPSVSGFNNPRWMGLLNKPQNRNLLERYNSLKVESLERAGATQGRADAITKEVISGKKVNTMFLENIGQPTVKRSQPNISRYGFNPAVMPDIQRTFNSSLDTRWEKLIKGVAFDSFSKIPHKELSRMGGMKSLMGGLTTRGLTQAPVALGPVRGRVFEEMLSSMSTVVNKNIPETGMEGLDFANRKFKSRYKNLFTQGPAITGLGGQGMEIRSGSISNPHALRKAGFAAGGSLGEAISRETAAGVPRSAIRIGASSSLASGLNPAGLGVYNTIDEPGGLSQGINMHRASGLDPKKAGIPNFAGFSGPAAGAGGMSGRTMAGMSESKRAMSAVTPDVTEEAIDDFLGTTKEATSSMDKWQGRALQASFIFPMVSGQLQSMVGTGTKASKYMESFSDGIGVASSFFAIGGPWGLGVGAVVGGFTMIDGALSTASSNVLELSKKADESKEQLTKAGNALSAYGDGLQRYQEALRTGDAELTVRLQRNLNKQLAEVPAAFREQVLSAKNATDLQNKVGDSLEEMAKQNAKTQFAASLEKTVTGERTGFANSALRDFGSEAFDANVFEEIPGAAKKFASELRSTLDFDKLSKDLKEVNFELGNKDEFINRLEGAGAGEDVIAGIKDLTGDDIKRLQTEFNSLAIKQQLATEQVKAHNDITEKYSKSIEHAARTVKLLEDRFKTFITNGNKAAQMLNDQVTASDKLREQVRSSRRGDKLGDAQRSLATRKPFMTEENIAVSEARIKRRKSLDDRNASMLDADIGATTAKRGAVTNLRTDLLKVLEASAARDGGRRDPKTNTFIPVMTPEEQKKISAFFQQTNALISGQGSIIADPFGGQGGTAGPSDTATNLIDLLPDKFKNEMLDKGSSAQLDILKANQTQSQKLDIIAEEQKQSRITDEKQLQAQLEQISIQKDIAGAGGMEGFASGQGLDQALDKFSTGMVGMIAGRKRGSLSIAGRGAAMVEGSIQDVTGRPSGNMRLRNMAAAGRAENLNWGMGLMRGGLGSMGLGANGLGRRDANRMAQNQADAFFKTGAPITPEGDAADKGLSLKLQQHGLKSAYSREKHLKGILDALSNPETVINATQLAKEQQEQLEKNRGKEIASAIKDIASAFNSFTNKITEQQDVIKNSLSGFEQAALAFTEGVTGYTSGLGVFLKGLDAFTGKANGHLPNFAGGRRGEKRSVMDSSQYSPTEKSRAIPNRKMVNGQMTFTNHLEKIKNNYGGSGQSAVLTPAMMRGGFANGYVPNFAGKSGWALGEVISDAEYKELSKAGQAGFGKVPRSKTGLEGGPWVKIPEGASSRSSVSNSKLPRIPHGGLFQPEVPEIKIPEIPEGRTPLKSSGLPPVIKTPLDTRVPPLLPKKGLLGKIKDAPKNIYQGIKNSKLNVNIGDRVSKLAKGTGKLAKGFGEVTYNVAGKTAQKIGEGVSGAHSFTTRNLLSPAQFEEAYQQYINAISIKDGSSKTLSKKEFMAKVNNDLVLRGQGQMVGARYHPHQSGHLTKGGFGKGFNTQGGTTAGGLFGQGQGMPSYGRKGPVPAGMNMSGAVFREGVIHEPATTKGLGTRPATKMPRIRVGGNVTALATELALQYAFGNKMDEMGLNNDSFKGWAAKEAGSAAISLGAAGTASAIGGAGFTAGAIAAAPVLPFAAAAGLGFHTYSELNRQELVNESIGNLLDGNPTSKEEMAIDMSNRAMAYYAMQRGAITSDEFKKIESFEKKRKDLTFLNASKDMEDLKGGTTHKGTNGTGIGWGNLKDLVTLNVDTVATGMMTDSGLHKKVKEQVDKGWAEYSEIKKKLSEFMSSKGLAQSKLFSNPNNLNKPTRGKGLNWDMSDLRKSLRLSMMVELGKGKGDRDVFGAMQEDFANFEKYARGAIERDSSALTREKDTEVWAGSIDREKVYNDQISALIKKGDMASLNKSQRMMAALDPFRGSPEGVLSAFKNGKMPKVAGPTPKVKPTKTKIDPWWINATDDEIVKREAKYNDLERGMKFGANKSLYSGEQAKLGKELTQAKEGKWLDSAGFVPKTAGGKSMASVHLGNTGDSSNLMDNTSYKRLMEVAIQDEGGYDAVKEPGHKHHGLINAYLDSLSKGEKPFWDSGGSTKKPKAPTPIQKAKPFKSPMTLNDDGTVTWHETDDLTWLRKNDEQKRIKNAMSDYEVQQAAPGEPIYGKDNLLTGKGRGMVEAGLNETKKTKEQRKADLIKMIGAEAYAKTWNEDGSVKIHDKKTQRAMRKKLQKEEKERKRYGGLTKAEWNRLSPTERRMRSGGHGFADGYIPNFASLTPDYSQFSWRNNDNSLNPYDRNFMMSTPGLRGLLNPNQSFGRTFANGLVPSIRASQNREKMQSGRNDVYSRYVDTPKYSGMATFNGSERGREESIVRNHPNPKNAGATPNFASGTEAVGKLEKVMTNLNIQIASLSEKMAQVQSTGEGAQGQAQVSMSPLNVNVNHSGRLTAQVEEIQSQISSAVNEAMKQIAPALWRTIKGPATS